MFVLTTSEKGGVAELKIAALAADLGVPVLRPMTEQLRYDLAFDWGGRIWRVQCKWGSLANEGAVVAAHLGGSYHSPRGYVRSSYSADEVDLVAVWCAEIERGFLLPIELVAGRCYVYLRLTPPRNGQRACVNLASDFDFTGAVAQLEERRHGMAEARGSSPLSSTSSATASVIGSHEFREHFGWYLERAAAGDQFHITRHGRGFATLSQSQRG